MIKEKDNLSIYFTAGFPQINDTADIIMHLQIAGADMIEIGMPYSDPLADGPTIQESSLVALKNGMSISLLFQQLESIRNQINIPLVIMGYFNPLLQFGVEKFCQKAKEVGIQALILPDMPLDLYEKKYQTLFEYYLLKSVFLITPQTPSERIKKIDHLTTGFIYAVSSATTTGGTGHFSENQIHYFQSLKKLGLKNKVLIGFGIDTNKQYQIVNEYANGAIIGSAFIKHLANTSTQLEDITSFIEKIKHN
jgi:tryptophan synthase alpha chain